MYFKGNIYFSIHFSGFGADAVAKASLNQSFYYLKSRNQLLSYLEVTGNEH